MTVVKIPPKSQKKGEPLTLVKNLNVAGKANLEVLGEHGQLAFDEINLLGPVRVKMGESTEKLKIFLRDRAHISASSTLDFSDV